MNYLLHFASVALSITSIRLLIGWILVSLCVPTTPSLCQSVVASQEVTIGNESRYELFARPTGETILYRDEPGKVMLNAYGPSMDQLWTRELNLDKSRPSPLGAVLFDGEINVFYTYRKNKGIYLKMHRYADNGNLSDSLTLLELKDEFLRSSYRLLADEHGKYAIFMADRDSETSLLICVEVESGRVLHTSLVNYEFGTALNRQLGEPFVDHSGAIFYWMQRNNRRSKLEEHEIKIIRINNDGSSLSATIDMSDDLIYDLTLGVDHRNQHVVLGGYYAENPDEAAGTLTLKIDYDFQGDATVQKRPFASDIIGAVEQKERNPAGIKDLEALDLVFQNNGTAIIIGEQRKKTIRTVGGRTGYFNGSVKTDYLYEDILITAINSAGEGEWQEVLPKKQFSQDDGGAFSGYFLASSPRALRLIHNDEVRSGGTVSEYTLNALGQVDRHSLMNTEYRDLWLRLEAGVQADANTIIVPSERRNRLKMVRITF